LSPDWIGRLQADSTLTLDALLAQAVGPVNCRADFSTGELDSVAALAGRETAGVLTTRAALRREFLARTGWQLAIELPGTSPLWPEQFDPWNLTPLADGEVLHQRLLRLAGEHGHLELLDQWALTTPAGAHPLFNGIRGVLLCGLAERPAITVHGDTTLVQGRGIDGSFVGMELLQEGQRLTLRAQ
jgi:hypothetical protein